ncbi:recombinase family protein [Anaerobranca gottschalkii]|uniref:Site-specific DNA recombinase n=1 Tax=Anaerobranca gottschalkii DSM 13577 TaxID=1120990 RepID=A0A1I0B8R1_9FIRM|nr:recombinase family protein [Anaerobranca gottschalkii]SET03089.1 Site-specific DNA recombinase [Anaerobranca gottschalkii DSM 13577]
MSAKAVKIIPATITKIQRELPQKEKKRVVAYARVSTDSEEQLSSYEAQVEYYTKHIQSNPNWEFAGIYTDEGISATNTKKRDGFNKMIEDALDGKIDMIITKSVSRFARNTVDTLTTVRKLKEKGVEVYFEKENIYTLDTKGELLITIMSSLAQEESRSISENVTWGTRKQFADGKVRVPYRRFLGYEKGEDGRPKIVEEEAKIVRLIYKLFLEGRTIRGIVKYLEKANIPSPGGKKKWQDTTVKSILKNEKYKGDALLQKTFTVDFLTKKKKVNEGEVPMYYVENSHPPIIEPRIFDLAQQEFKKREGLKRYKAASIFSGKIICGQCKAFFGPKVWHSNNKYRRIIWQCNHKYENNCTTTHLYEEEIKEIFIEVFNNLIEKKEEVVKDYQRIIETLTDTDKLGLEKKRLEEELERLTEKIRDMVETNAKKALDQRKYQQKYTQLVEEYKKVKGKLEEIEEKIFENKIKVDRLKEFIGILKDREKLLTSFDEELWLSTVDLIEVSDGVRVIFKNGVVVENNQF